ncbi:MAG: NAD(P)-binding domain-containing protein, partial [Eggerthellaceae bacterium]|nr:NAD(P)-binding domain-containing protein [Eggerthellaceae bacterium]
MALAYAYRGAAGLIEAVAPRLEAAGLALVDDVATAEVIVSFCTSQSELEDCYFGDAGFIQEVAPGALLVDLSATTPNFAREINAVATVSDLAMVEAPLVVVDTTAADSFARDNLSCFAAGEGDGVQRARGLLDALCGSVHEVGGPGAAQLARAAYTLQTAAQVIATIEAQALYRAVRRSVAGTGLGIERVGAATPAAERVLRAVEEERFEGAYNVEMLMSELSAAIMAADDAELILPQAEAAMHLLELLAVIGGADKAPAALSLVYGEESECAKNGLDWTRAEEAYGAKSDDDEWDDDYDD